MLCLQQDCSLSLALRFSEYLDSTNFRTGFLIDLRLPLSLCSGSAVGSVGASMIAVLNKSVRLYAKSWRYVKAFASLTSSAAGLERVP